MIGLTRVSTTSLSGATATWDVATTHSTLAAATRQRKHTAELVWQQEKATTDALERDLIVVE
jgi:hypothetical protein